VARPIRDIPSEHVGMVVQTFIDNGEPQLQVAQQNDGRFTVTPFATEGRSFSAVPKFKKLLTPEVD
jgi:hypothetical protein